MLPTPKKHTIALGEKTHFYYPFILFHPEIGARTQWKSFTFRYCSVRCIKLQPYKSYVDFSSKKAHEQPHDREGLGCFWYHVVSCFLLIKGAVGTLKCHETCLKLKVDSNELPSEDQVYRSKHGTPLEWAISADPYRLSKGPPITREWWL